MIAFQFRTSSNLADMSGGGGGGCGGGGENTATDLQVHGDWSWR